jgi:hypothetical protein
VAVNRPVTPRSHVFISYARSDGEAFARDIHERLEGEEDLTCWRDRLDLEGGENFWSQLERGISDARWVLIVLTPGALKSEWTAQEWREARKRGVPICPVWPLRAKELGAHLEHSRLPAGMQRSHVYTPFPTGEATSTRAQEEWRNLVSTLRVEKDVARAPFMAPPPPADYVHRGADVAAVMESLLPGQKAHPAGVAALRGTGGMGKTTLAKVIARSDEVVDTFYDGVLWITLGTQPKLVESIADLCRTIDRDRDVHFSGLTVAASHLRALLENRRCLIVIDDVWKVSDLQPFIGLGPTVTALITTRIAEVARVVGQDAQVDLGTMTEDQAVRFLLSTIPSEHSPSVKHRCRELARRLGRWPLLLRLATGQLRAQFDCGESAEEALGWVDACLREGGVTALDADASSDDFENEHTRDRAVAISIGGSLGVLRDAERQAFIDLGVFPEDIPIPLATAGQLWGVRDAKGMALKLANLSLVDVQLGQHPTISLHDQILRYAAKQLTLHGHGAEVHRRLVTAWKDPAAPPDDYAWRWVCHHLKEAGDEHRLLAMLFDFDAVAKRLMARSVGIDRLVADYGLVGHVEDAARIANEARYGEFVDVADSHLAELRTAIPRLAPDTDIDLIQQSSGVERSVGYLLVRLRRSPTLDRPWSDFAIVLHEAAERIATFAATAEPVYNAERNAEVASIIGADLEGVDPDELRRSADRFVRARFAIQTSVLSAVRERGAFSIATVRDDIDRRLALPYFFIDLALLRHTSKSAFRAIATG